MSYPHLTELPRVLVETSLFEGFKATITAEEVARQMKIAHSRNANFLLNVGPDKQGRIVESSRKVLAEIPAAVEKIQE